MTGDEWVVIIVIDDSWVIVVHLVLFRYSKFKVQYAPYQFACDDKVWISTTHCMSFVLPRTVCRTSQCRNSLWLYLLPYEKLCLRLAYL